MCQERARIRSPRLDKAVRTGTFARNSRILEGARRKIHSVTSSPAAYASVILVISISTSGNSFPDL
jgi:hypothetical protein